MEKKPDQELFEAILKTLESLHDRITELEARPISFIRTNDLVMGPGIEPYKADPLPDVTWPKTTDPLPNLPITTCGSVT